MRLFYENVNIALCYILCSTHISLFSEFIIQAENHLTKKVACLVDLII